MSKSLTPTTLLAKPTNTDKSMARIKRAINKFDAAAQEYAFKGAEGYSIRKSIEANHKIKRQRLEKTILEELLKWGLKD